MVMAKRFHASICEDGTCTDIGEFRDQAKAEARVAKEAKKRWKKHSKEKIPKGHIHGEVRGVEGGIYDSKPVYETEINAGEPKPKVKRRRARAVEEPVAE